MSTAIKINSSRSNNAMMARILIFAGVACAGAVFGLILLAKMISQVSGYELPGYALSYGPWAVWMLSMAAVTYKVRLRRLSIEITSDNMLLLKNGNDTRSIRISEIRKISFSVDDQGEGWRFKKGLPSQFRRQSLTVFVYYVSFVVNNSQQTVDFNDYTIGDFSLVFKTLLNENPNISIDKNCQDIMNLKTPEIYKVLGTSLLENKYRKMIKEGVVQVTEEGEVFV